MSLELGFDYSCFVQPEISQAQAQAFRAAGLVRCCLAMDTSPETFNSAQALNAAGIKLDGYRELHGPSSYASDTLKGIAAFDPLSKAGVKIRRYWLTAEDLSVGQRPDLLVPALHAAVAAAQGYDVGIYSGLWYWPLWMGNSTDFAKLPLWHAGYDHHADIEAVTYGGWTQMNAHQYDSPITVAGVPLDLDAWWIDDAPPGPTPQPGPNVDDAIIHLEAALNDLKKAA